LPGSGAAACHEHEPMNTSVTCARPLELPKRIEVLRIVADTR
jgi:hypothetical protein